MTTVAAQHQHQASVGLGVGSAAARHARRWLTDQLDRWGAREVAPTAELLVSELVTNAVCHAGSEVELTARMAGERLRVEVHDEGEGEPEVEQPDTTTTGGRGLMIVERLAEQWGWREDANGKVVWFELPVRGRIGV